MEPKFQTSFIPKKPIVANPGSAITVVRTTSIVSVVSSVLFLITIMTAGGLFFYKGLLKGQIEEADKNIISARAAFEPEKIKELVDAHSRIVSSQKLLERHVMVSNLLTLLQELTVRKMRFTDFEYAHAETGPTLALKGEVQTYNALAQQGELFANTEFIKKSEFSNFDLGDNGYISFDIIAEIDPNLISYKKNIESQPLQ